VFVVFFFSSRRRHTRFSRDWSSDVCSSDLPRQLLERRRRGLRVDGELPQDHALELVVGRLVIAVEAGLAQRGVVVDDHHLAQSRSEERRVGKSVDLGGGRSAKQKKR